MASFNVTRKTTITEIITVTDDTKEAAITAAKAVTSTPSISVSASGVTVTAIPAGTTVSTRQNWKAQSVNT